MAKVGDILTVEILELIPNHEKKTLVWLGARVMDVDPTRKEPYYASQAVDMARRRDVLQKNSVVVVPTSGPRHAVLAFVGASPGKVEAARGENFVGPSGQVLNEQYLKPLGLPRAQVLLVNAVPQYLGDEEGRVREPTDDEIAQWHDWLIGELDRERPQLIVALGQTAKRALGGLADFVLPHPMAVQRFGDSGELGRKLKQVQAALRRVNKDAEGEETRGTTAERWWAENWHTLFPPSGKGMFVFQHHWRGLPEEETKLDDRDLLQTDHSVHGDLRFEGAKGELWGFSVFLGTTADNRKAGGDRLIGLPKDDKLRGSFKLPQPKSWLEVGVKKPLVVEPGGPGSTSQTYSKFFAVDRGDYEVGVVREHAAEVFLKGAKLKGRLLLQFAPMGGRRVWLVSRPADQTPAAETHNLEDTVTELRQKKQKYLLWRSPGEGGRLRRIDVTAGAERTEKEYYAEIVKADDEKQLVIGVVLEPETRDTQGDVISADEIEQAAHRFLVESRVVGQQHKRKVKAEVVECYVAPANFSVNGQAVKKGSWVLGVHISDSDLWKAVKAGEYTGFSVGGVALREEAPSGA